VTEIAAPTEWSYLRHGSIAVLALVAAALIGWGIDSALWEDSGFAKLSRCLTVEKELTLETPRDPIAQSAELGAVRTVVETNGVTVAVASGTKSAERIIASYHAIAGDLQGRLEQRGRLVYLWDRPASPTQRQTMYDCTY
jgi:hypothetical protein